MKELFAYLPIHNESFLSRGKPKKGRTAPRDGKRIRPSSEADLDDEDDPDLSLR